MRATEAEIVADCCSELEALAKPSQASAQPRKVETETPKASAKTTVEKFFEDDRLAYAYGDGEDKAVDLFSLSRRIADIRRSHFDPEKALTNPKFFILPATNENGDYKKTCPTYLYSVGVTLSNFLIPFSRRSSIWLPNIPAVCVPPARGHSLLPTSTHAAEPDRGALGGVCQTDVAAYCGVALV